MRISPKTYADQRNASASGDIVARDKITQHYSKRKTQIDGWVEKLAEEMRGNPAMVTFVDNLQYFFQPSPYDEHVGLEAKLDRAGRSDQKKIALRKKEVFAKLLEEWKAYPSAQEIIAYFLSKIEASFELCLAPVLADASASEIDELIHRRLVEPVLDEMASGPFMLNYNHVSGMVYWLAEQCYVRWHQ